MVYIVLVVGLGGGTVAVVFVRRLSVLAVIPFDLRFLHLDNIVEIDLICICARLMLTASFGWVLDAEMEQEKDIIPLSVEAWKVETT